VEGSYSGSCDSSCIDISDILREKYPIPIDDDAVVCARPDNPIILNDDDDDANCSSYGPSSPYGDVTAFCSLIPSF
jgi:hypothetical protein